MSWDCYEGDSKEYTDVVSFDCPITEYDKMVTSTVSDSKDEWIRLDEEILESVEQ